MHICTKNTKNNLTILPQIADKVFLCIVGHHPLFVEQCFFVDSYLKLSSSLPCALNYDNAKIDQ